jgi:N-acetylneuraminate synthase
MAAVIREVKKGFEADGNGVKEPVASELPDRVWRADPTDGLRPLKEIREQWR